jgi:hypothetical protein
VKVAIAVGLWLQGKRRVKTTTGWCAMMTMPPPASRLRVSQGGSTPPPLTCITRIPGIQRQTLRLIHHMQPFTHTPQPSRPHHTMLPHSLATHNPSALSLTSNPLFPNPTTAPYCNSHAHYSTALHPPHELCQPVPPDDRGRQEHVPKRNYGIPLGRDNQVR